MSKTILVVDDSGTMILSLKNNLEISGFKVITANDGAAALARLGQAPKPDLIITDINMPNMGGIEFIGKARALRGFRFTPILVLSTESQQAKRDEARSAGASGWMVKPVPGAELLKIVKQVLPGSLTWESSTPCAPGYAPSRTCRWNRDRPARPLWWPACNSTKKSPCASRVRWSRPRIPRWPS
nr:response regulator [Herbaspirillum sp. B39]